MDDFESTVCFCYGVSRQQLVSAIQAGAASVSDLQLDTLATLGCGGCLESVVKILEDECAQGEVNPDR
jgi:nitrite reductase (NADH) large subunit